MKMILVLLLFLPVATGIWQQNRGRCYLEDLKIKTGLSIKSSNVSESGERLDVKCIEGYTVNEEKPICEDGEWKEGTGACKESNCTVQWIEQGAITELKVVNRFNWKKFRWENKNVFEQVQISSTVATENELYVTCLKSYSFQGTGENNVRIRCKKGRWEPHPVCLINRCYLQDLMIKTGVSEKSRNVTESGERLDVKCIEGYTINKEKPICEDGGWKEGTGACKESNCIARWIQHGAITEKKLVYAGFDWTKFRCIKKAVFKPVPLHSVMAAGSELYVTCMKEYTFQGTGENNVTIRCKEGRWEPHPVCLINMMCPELKECEHLRIVYSDDRKIKSLATFHCLAETVRSGVSQATCLPNGTWSDETPSCQLPLCPAESLFDVIPESVVPRIEDIENNTLTYGSKLRLMCEDGLILIGTSTASCGKAGIWEVGNVQCIQGCAAIDKMNDSKLIIHPEKEAYKFGEQIALSCPDGFVLTPTKQRMMCMHDGWYDRVMPECKVL